MAECCVENKDQEKTFPLYKISIIAEFLSTLNMCLWFTMT